MKKKFLKLLILLSGFVACFIFLNLNNAFAKTVNHKHKSRIINKSKLLPKNNPKLQIKPSLVKSLENSKEQIIPKNPITRKLWKGITLQELEILKQISLQLKKENYSASLILANSLKGKSDFAEALINIVLWNKYSGNIEAKEVAFGDISRFALDNRFYPNISEIRKNVEKVAIGNNIAYKFSEQFFKNNPPLSLSSKLYLLQSKIIALSTYEDTNPKKIELAHEIRAEISNIWVRENFSAEQENKFLNLYNNQLSEKDHILRLNRLMWEARFEDAKRILNFVNDDHKKLFLAITELHNAPKYIDNIILSVPRKLRDNEVLTYHRILWYKSKKQVDDLLELLIRVPSTASYPKKWWQLRKLYSREMIKFKKYKAAYVIAANHGLPATSSNFWEAEWMSGWIALRFLDKPKDAYIHFWNLHNNVTQPVTLARSTYWLGMSAQAMGDKKKAMDWYKLSTKYPIFFYGQLGIHKYRLLDSLNAQNDIILPKDPDITESDIKFISAMPATKIAYLMAVTGERRIAGKIFESIINNASTNGQIGVIIKIVNEINDLELNAEMSRVAGKKNVFFIKNTFKIIDGAKEDEYAPLVHALIKQESAFSTKAISSVGALGYMQLMPETAKLVAKELGTTYNKNKLVSDKNYNIKLGSHYIRKLINQFNGSELLAIASYNAGPGATQRWINEFYDPRQQKDLDKVVDWIELITYSETRNYVQRIMENLIVYKYIMSRQNYDKIN
jgi:soluble lytic murein transglycosylase